jgi:hypothetical protein
MSLNSRWDRSKIGGQPPSVANLIPSASKDIGGSTYLGRQRSSTAYKSRKADVADGTPICC